MENHKSANSTFVFKYLFVPIWIGIFLVSIIHSWNSESQASQDWAQSASLMVGWGVIWLGILAARLKNIEATSEYIIIKSIFKKTIVQYQDIEWVYQIAMINPRMISFKYKDQKKRVTKKIITYPRTNSFMGITGLLEEADMTEFIRQQIILAKPNYSKEDEPSRWVPIILIMATGAPIGILTNIFFLNSI